MASVQITSEAVQNLRTNAAGSAPAAKPKGGATQNTLVSDAILGKQKAVSEPTGSLLKDLSSKINAIFDAMGKSLHYSVHDATNQIVVRVVDDNTGEVVREIPQTKFLDMVSKLEKLTGFILNEKA